VSTTSGIEKKKTVFFSLPLCLDKMKRTRMEQVPISNQILIFLPKQNTRSR